MGLSSSNIVRKTDKFAKFLFRRKFIWRYYWFDIFYNKWSLVQDIAWTIIGGVNLLIVFFFLLLFRFFGINLLSIVFNMPFGYSLLLFFLPLLPSLFFCFKYGDYLLKYVITDSYVDALIRKYNKRSSLIYFFAGLMDFLLVGILVFVLFSFIL